MVPPSTLTLNIMRTVTRDTTPSCFSPGPAQFVYKFTSLLLFILTHILTHLSS